MENIEQSRIFKILIEQIQGDIKGRELWKNLETCPEEIREKQINEFDCQILTLALFAEKVYGIRKEEIIKYAKDNM